jgi:hypothetical protein
VAGDDFNGVFIERDFEQSGRLAREADTSARTRAGSALMSIPTMRVARDAPTAAASVRAG